MANSSPPSSGESLSSLRRRIQKPTNNVYDKLFTRRLSIYITLALHRLGWSPNQVSTLATSIGVAACVLIGVGSQPSVLIGAALIHLYALLDSVDGELARWTRQFSLKGLFLEDLSAYTMTNGVNLAVAFYLFASTQSPYPLVAAVWIAAFGRNAMPVLRRIVIHIATAQAQEPASALHTASRLNPQETLTQSRLFRAIVVENILHVPTIWATLSTSILLEQTLPFYSVEITSALFYFFAVGQVLKELHIYRNIFSGNAIAEEVDRLQRRPRITPPSPNPPHRSSP